MTSAIATRRRVLALLVVLPALVPLGFAAAAPQKVGFVGAGRMGSALGTLLVNAGYEVMFSSRHPEELKSLVDGLGARAHAGTVADAVKFGEVVILTVPYAAVPDIAREHGRALAAKPLVIDVGNPVPTRDGEIGEIGREKGAGIYLAGLMPGVRIVRAFNSMNWAKLPEYATRKGDRKVGAPIVGDDRQAIALAERLIRDMGFEPVLIGGLAMSKHTAPREPLADDHTAAEVRRIAAGLK
jgi:predicted dinucleotide-binding enzyme